MKIMKRNFCLLFTFVLAFTFLTGCGGHLDNSNSPSVNPNSAATNDNTNNSAPSSATVPSADPGNDLPDSFVYITEENIIPMSESALIDGVSCRILDYKLSTEFGNRKQENLNYFYEDGGIDEKCNLIDGKSYLFITFEYTNTTDSEIEIIRGSQGVYSIDNRFIIQNYDLDAVYIDEYWQGGSLGKRFHYKLAPGETITSEAGWIVGDDMLNNDGGLYFSLRMEDCLTDHGGTTDPNAIFVELEF